MNKGLYIKSMRLVDIGRVDGVLLKGEGLFKPVRKAIAGGFSRINTLLVCVSSHLTIN